MKNSQLLRILAQANYDVAVTSNDEIYSNYAHILEKHATVEEAEEIKKDASL